MHDPNVQFSHSSPTNWTRGSTLACYVPDKDVFLELIQLGTDKTLVVALGKAVCSSDDIYYKKVGRNVAISKMGLVQLTLKFTSYIGSDKMILEFESEYGILRFQVNQRSNRVYFLG